jgi:hypothetical protein
MTPGERAARRQGAEVNRSFFAGNSRITRTTVP